MAKTEFTFKRGKAPGKFKPRKPPRAPAGPAVKVISISNEYRDRYDNIKGFKKLGF